MVQFLFLGGLLLQVVLVNWVLIRMSLIFYEHRRPILSPTSGYVQTSVTEHFLSNNHSHSHMLLIAIEKLINQPDSFRKAREVHLIEKAQTTEPLGIKKRDG